MIADAIGAGPACRARVEGADWEAVAAELDDLGCALLPPSAHLGRRPTSDQALRQRRGVPLHRHYGAEPSSGWGECPPTWPAPPGAGRRARARAYPHLLPIARDWYTRLGRPTPWPEPRRLVGECHRAGQTKPTPLILKYGQGDWNALHRDLYGDLVFPLQVVINLTEPGRDHTGGEFLLVEQRPEPSPEVRRRPFPHLQALVFTTRDRPVRALNEAGQPPRYATASRSCTRCFRYTIGIPFHDAP